MKKFLLLVLILTAITLPANAEQPAAEEYRQMFRSGNFYVEYQMFLPTKVKVNALFQEKRIDSPKFTLAGQNGNRMQRIVIEKIQSEYWNHNASSTKLSSIYKDVFKNFERTNLKNANHGKRSWMNSLLFGESKKNYPDALFQDGKYYRFRRNSEGTTGLNFFGDGGAIYGKVLPQEDLHSPTLNQDDE
ncbi:MAG: hypothetical protein IJ685_07790 [Selenomonadaceae bacterium]|nr:hypothetical protein [Selenomonadaceae bacterium]